MERNPVLQSQLVEDSGVPLYYQLVGIIKRSITSGILKSGDMLPSEAEITDTYRVSRSTVRQAFSALEAEGLIFRRRGKGTFISSPKIKRKLDNLYSFSNDMVRQGLTPKSQMLDFQRITPSVDITRSMNLNGGFESVYKIVRVRIADDEPLSIETTFLPVKYYPQLEKEMLENDSLYRILRESAALNPYYAVEAYEPVVIKGNEAKILNCRSGMCGYFVERTSYLETGEVFELTQSLVRGDRCRFEVELYKDGVNFSRKVNSKINI